VFGISFTELTLIALVTLVVVGPHRLPGMLRTVGEWARRLRRITTEVRAQTGIDEVLRQEGIEGGIVELRSMMRGDFSSVHRERQQPQRVEDPYREPIEIDRSREYPPEGVDAAYALADDLVDEAAVSPATAPAASSEASGSAPQAEVVPATDDAPASQRRAEA
jgi:sec-independent protein translocase protein TatB